MDILMKLSALSHLKAQDSESSLRRLAEDQESKLGRKRDLRRLQDKKEEIAQGGTVDRDGLKEYFALAQQLQVEGSQETLDKLNRGEAVTSIFGMEHDSGWEHGFDLKEKTTGGVTNTDAASAQFNRNRWDKSFDSQVQTELEDLEDSEVQVNFKIQMGVSELTAAEQARAGAMKRLEDHRKETQKWAG